MAADPGADTLTFTWDFGDGDALQGQGLTSADHIYSDDGVYFVTLTVADEDGAVVSRTLPVLVANVAPTITLSGDPSTGEGASYAFTLGDIQDPGDDPIDELIVDWEDGTIDSYSSPGTVDHTFADNPHNHTIRVSLREGGRTTYTRGPSG